MPRKTSDIDSIIQLLRDQHRGGLAGGEGEMSLSSSSVGELDVPDEGDRTTLVIVLGVIAGLLIGAILYYLVGYSSEPTVTHVPAPHMPPAPSPAPILPSTSQPSCEGAQHHPEDEKSTAATCGASLKKAPARLAAEKPPIKNKRGWRVVKDASPPIQLARVPVQLMRVSGQKAVNLAGDEKPVFSVASSKPAAGFSISKMGTGMTSEFKVPPKPMQPSIETAKSISTGGGASKLLEANKQLVEATSGTDTLRKKLQVAQDGLSMYTPEVPTSRRHGEDAYNTTLNRMREKNGEKLTRMQNNSRTPSLFETPMYVMENLKPLPGSHASSDVQIGTKIHTTPDEDGVKMDGVATLHFD
tara:strand:- start:6748 stop:7818 length:1071 start_codon:yes stop_codon:yes gene_type:complete